MLNEPQYLLAARSLALIVLSDQELRQEEDRLKVAYETITSKLPDAEEVESLVNLLEDLETFYRLKPELADALCQGSQLPETISKFQLAGWSMVVSTLYNLDITKTRE